MAEWITHGFSVGMLAEGVVAVITPATVAEVRECAPRARIRVSDRSLSRALRRVLGVTVLRNFESARVEPGDTVYAASCQGRGVRFTRVRLLSRDELVAMVSPSLGESDEWRRVAEEVTRLTEVWRG